MLFAGSKEPKSKQDDQDKPSRIKRGLALANHHRLLTAGGILGATGLATLALMNHNSRNDELGRASDREVDTIARIQKSGAKCKYAATVLFAGTKVRATADTYEDMFRVRLGPLDNAYKKGNVSFTVPEGQQLVVTMPVDLRRDAKWQVFSLTDGLETASAKTSTIQERADMMYAVNMEDLANQSQHMFDVIPRSDGSPNSLVDCEMNAQGQMSANGKPAAYGTLLPAGSVTAIYNATGQQLLK